MFHQTHEIKGIIIIQVMADFYVFFLIERCLCLKCLWNITDVFPKTEWFQLFLTTTPSLFCLFCFLGVYASEEGNLQTPMFHLNKTLSLLCHYRLLLIGPRWLFKAGPLPPFSCPLQDYKQFLGPPGFLLGGGGTNADLLALCIGGFSKLCVIFIVFI